MRHRAVGRLLRHEVSAEGAAAAGIASVPSAVLLHCDVGRGLCT